MKILLSISGLICTFLLNAASAQPVWTEASDANLVPGKPIKANQIKEIRDAIGWNVSGSNAYRASGNVGIGTTSPAHKLDVAGNIRTTGRDIYFGTGDQRIHGTNTSAYYMESNHDTVTQLIMKDKQDTTYGRLYGDSNGAQFGLLDGDSQWGLLMAKDNYTSFRINNSEKMRILSNGSVGIGTTSPSQKLSVNGGAIEVTYNGAGTVMTLENKEFIRKLTDRGGVRIGADDSIFLGSGESPDIVSNGVGTSAQGGEYTYIASDNQVYIYPGQQSGYNVARRTVFDSSGSVGIGNATPGGTFDNGKALALGDSDTGIRQDGDGHLELWTNNGERVHVTNTGNVGIGTASPAHKLDVAGNIRTTGRNVYFGTGEQKIYGDNGGTFYMDSNHDTFSVLRLRDKQDENLTALYAYKGTSAGDKSHFGLMDSDNQWAFFNHTDAYSQIRINNIAQMHIDTGSTYLRSQQLQLGWNRSGNRYAYLDLVGDDTYTDYGLRIMRGNGGANSGSEIAHRGTGNFTVGTRDAADLKLLTNWTERLTVKANTGNVGIGTSSPGSKLDVSGTIRAEEICDETGANCQDISAGWASGGSGSGSGGSTADFGAPENRTLGTTYTETTGGIVTASGHRGSGGVCQLSGKVNGENMAGDGGGYYYGNGASISFPVAAGAEWIVTQATGSYNCSGINLKFTPIEGGGSGSGGSTSPMVEGWPDAIVCKRNLETRVLIHSYQDSGQVQYQQAVDSGATRYYLRFNLDGTYHSNQRISSSDCLNKSITELYTEKKAFNFVGGSGSGSWLIEAGQGYPAEMLGFPKAIRCFRTNLSARTAILRIGTYSSSIDEIYYNIPYGPDNGHVRFNATTGAYAGNGGTDNYSGGCQATDIRTETGVHVNVSEDSGSSGGGASGALISAFEAAGGPTVPVAISETSNKWPDYIICDYSNSTVKLTLDYYSNALDQVNYAREVYTHNYLFKRDGSYAGRSSGVPANCGAGGNTIQDICADNHCGFFGES